MGAKCSRWLFSFVIGCYGVAFSVSRMQRPPVIRTRETVKEKLALLEVQYSQKKKYEKVHPLFTSLSWNSDAR